MRWSACVLLLLPLVAAKRRSASPPNLDLKNPLEDRRYVSRLFSSERRRSLGRGWEGVECSVCRTVVRGLHYLWNEEPSQVCVAQLIAILCQHLKIENPTICQAMSSEYRVSNPTHNSHPTLCHLPCPARPNSIPEATEGKLKKGNAEWWFQDEVLYVVGEVVLAPSQVCGLLFSDCGEPFDPLHQNWTLPIPPDQPPTQPWPTAKVSSRQWTEPRRESGIGKHCSPTRRRFECCI